MRKIAMFFVASAFICSVAIAQAPCDKAKLDNLKVQKKALLEKKKTIVDPAQRKTMNKNLRDLGHQIKIEAKNCKKK
ncbi:MAG: hypothetical protein V1647_05145 [Pseudomonadota bacterium]